MTEDHPPILIATDRADEGESIARTLSEEFAKVHVSADTRRGTQDFELHWPAVLVLAFNSLAKAERHLRELRQPRVMVQAPPHRVLMLASQEEMREVYELCKRDHVDDFVLFSPRMEETRPLRMAVRRALRQAAAAREGRPAAADFAAHARRLALLEPVLEGAVQAGGSGTADERLAPLRALRALAERCQPLVLVVDDDKFQHKLLGRLLAQVNVDVTYVATVGEAVTSLHRRRPDLILMDVELPDVGGVEATRLLKSAGPFAGIPVVMVTGLGGKAVVVDSLKAGAADFIVKPFDKDIVLGKVRRLLYGR